MTSRPPVHRAGGRLCLGRSGVCSSVGLQAGARGEGAWPPMGGGRQVGDAHAG
jgi:hypothetical protein